MSVLKGILTHLAIRHDPVKWARSMGVRVGERCRFVKLMPSTFGSEPYLVTIGNHVTITAGVQFVTHDGGVWVLRDEFPDLDVVAPIFIGDNVFVGVNTVILPGVTIGSNTVIGAGSVVARSVPDRVVAAGVPAKVLRSFDDYRASSLSRGVFTKGLSAADKKRALLNTVTTTPGRRVDEGATGGVPSDRDAG